MKVRNVVTKCVSGAKEVGRKVLCKKSRGMSDIIVFIGLAILGLALVAVMQEPLETFITTMVGNFTTKAQEIMGITS